MDIYKQLEQVTEQLQLDKPVYYYETEWQISVCLLALNPHHTPAARGIAICSPLDQFDKGEGRKLALGRALRALKKRVTTEPINFTRFDEHRSFIPRHKEVETRDRLIMASRVYDAKSVYLPKLTEFEKILLGESVT